MRTKAGRIGVPAIVGGMVNLNHPTHYIHWGWFSMSVANFTLIVLMAVVFALAIVVPFPKGRRS